MLTQLLEKKPKKVLVKAKGPKALSIVELKELIDECESGDGGLDNHTKNLLMEKKEVLINYCDDAMMFDNMKADEIDSEKINEILKVLKLCKFEVDETKDLAVLINLKNKCQEIINKFQKIVNQEKKA